jgi:hypothetical protein
MAAAPDNYYGQRLDQRVKPQPPDPVAKAIVLDYALSSHVAPLGLATYTGKNFGKYRDGAFVGELGSWDRTPLNGYKVVIVPFSGESHPARPRTSLLAFSVRTTECKAGRLDRKSDKKGL